MKVKLIHIKVIKALVMHDGRYVDPRFISLWICNNRHRAEVREACNELTIAGFIQHEKERFMAHQSDLDSLLDHMMERDHVERKSNAVGRNPKRVR